MPPTLAYVEISSDHQRNGVSAFLALTLRRVVHYIRKSSLPRVQGRAMVKAVEVAEVIRRRVPHLHQLVSGKDVRIS